MNITPFAVTAGPKTQCPFFYLFPKKNIPKNWAKEHYLILPDKDKISPKKEVGD